MAKKYHIAIGPELPEHGSWEWIGGSFQRILRDAGYRVTTFQQKPPEADVYLLVKHPTMTEVIRGKPIFYAPVDRFGSGAEIDAHATFLFSCTAILLHYSKLTKYFVSYAPIEVMEHPLNFVPRRICDTFRGEGPLLWVGVRSNLNPVVDWLNHDRCSEEVWLLSNFENNVTPRQTDLGLSPKLRVRVESWTRKKHMDWLTVCRAAFDVKAEDFRARYKPPAKACDFIASGLPFAIEPNSSPGRYLQSRGFSVASPDQPEIWLSEEYWTATQEFRQELLTTNSEREVSGELLRILDQHLRNVGSTCS